MLNRIWGLAKLDDRDTNAEKKLNTCKTKQILIKARD